MLSTADRLAFARDWLQANWQDRAERDTFVLNINRAIAKLNRTDKPSGGYIDLGAILQSGTVTWTSPTTR